MLPKQFVLFLLLIFFTGSSSCYGQLSARDIVEKAEDRVIGKTSFSDMTIKIVRPSWSRDMSLKTWTKGRKLAMILITAPSKDKGTVFLKRGKEVWNWIPSIERSIKLPPSMMSQNWMGTDFTNDDLVKESSTVEDYDHFLRGEESIGGYNCYRIEMIPKPEAAIVWGKVILWIDKADFMQLKAEFFDEDGILVNRMEGKNIGILANRRMPQEFHMTPIDKKGNKTILIYNSLELDKPIDDSFFNTQKMKQIR